LSLLPPPPAPPLFPYTTLFRSGPQRLRQAAALDVPDEDVAEDGAGAEAAAVGAEAAAAQLPLPGIERAQRLARAGIPQPQGAVRDRKSTRLNSSHRTISYAVFC